MDSGSDCQSCTWDVPNNDNHPLLSPSPDNVDNFYSLIDRCGMAVLVDQVLYLVALLLLKQILFYV